MEIHRNGPGRSEPNNISGPLSGPGIAPWAGSHIVNRTFGIKIRMVGPKLDVLTIAQTTLSIL